MEPDVIRRVKKQNYSKNPYKCYLCGEVFKLVSCPHNAQDQILAVEAVRNEA